MRFIVFFQEIRQLTKCGLLAPLFPHLLGGHAEDGLARLDVLVDSGGGQDDGTSADDQVLVDTHTPPEDDVVLDTRHASDGGMGANEAVVADIAVVAYLAVVVEFGAALYDGVGRDAPVNAAQGTNLHVVGNDHAAKRLELLEAFVAALEIIAVGADDAARMNDDIVANHAVIVNRDVGMDKAVLANDGMMPDKRTRHNKRPLAYRRTVANRLGLRFERTEMPHQAHECIKRVGMKEQRFPFGTFHLFINKDHRCCRVEGLGVVFRMVDKGDVARLHLVDFVEARDGEVGGTNVFGINEFRYGF